MSYLLKRILVGVFIALVMMVVHKVARAAMPTAYYTNSAHPSLTFGSIDAACIDLIGGDASIYLGSVNYSAYYGCKFKSGGQTYTSNSVFTNPCPASGGPAVCGVPICNAGQTVQIRYDSGPRNRTAASTPAPPANVGGCSVQVTDIGTCHANVGDTSSNPHLYCYITVKNTGAAAPSGTSDATVTGSDPGGNPEPVQVQGGAGGSCPSGTSNIGSDSSGTSICRGNGTSSGGTKNTSTTTPTTTTANSDGSTTTSSSTSNGNNDGSTTTTTTACTTAAGGSKSCSTTGTTSPNAAGGAGKSDGKPDDPKDFCAVHPDLAVCVNSSVTGSGCNGATANLSFTGDAVQGAMLRDERNLLCANSQVTPMSTLGNAIQNGADPMQAQIDLAKTGTTVDLSSNALDSSGFLGGGSGFQDQTVSVAGHSLVLRFSKITDGVENLKYVVMACSLIAAYLLVSKSVIQGV